MGLFDKIKEIKTQYDNNQEAKREQEEEQKRKGHFRENLFWRVNANHCTQHH